MFRIVGKIIDNEQSKKIVGYRLCDDATGAIGSYTLQEAFKALGRNTVGIRPVATIEERNKSCDYPDPYVIYTDGSESKLPVYTAVGVCVKNPSKIIILSFYIADNVTYYNVVRDGKPYTMTMQQVFDEYKRASDMGMETPFYNVTIDYDKKIIKSRNADEAIPDLTKKRGDSLADAMQELKETQKPTPKPVEPVKPVETPKPAPKPVEPAKPAPKPVVNQTPIEYPGPLKGVKTFEDVYKIYGKYEHNDEDIALINKIIAILKLSKEHYTGDYSAWKYFSHAQLVAIVKFLEAYPPSDYKSAFNASKDTPEWYKCDYGHEDYFYATKDELERFENHEKETLRVFPKEYFGYYLDISDEKTAYAKAVHLIDVVYKLKNSRTPPSYIRRIMKNNGKNLECRLKDLLILIREFVALKMPYLMPSIIEILQNKKLPLANRFVGVYYYMLLSLPSDYKGLQKLILTEEDVRQTYRRNAKRFNECNSRDITNISTYNCDTYVNSIVNGDIVAPFVSKKYKELHEYGDNYLRVETMPKYIAKCIYGTKATIEFLRADAYNYTKEALDILHKNNGVYDDEILITDTKAIREFYETVMYANTPDDKPAISFSDFSETTDFYEFMGLYLEEAKLKGRNNVWYSPNNGPHCSIRELKTSFPSVIANKKELTKLTEDYVRSNKLLYIQYWHLHRVLGYIFNFDTTNHTDDEHMEYQDKFFKYAMKYGVKRLSDANFSSKGLCYYKVAAGMFVYKDPLRYKGVKWRNLYSAYLYDDFKKADPAYLEDVASFAAYFSMCMGHLPNLDAFLNSLKGYVSSRYAKRIDKALNLLKQNPSTIKFETEELNDCLSKIMQNTEAFSKFYNEWMLHKFWKSSYNKYNRTKEEGYDRGREIYGGDLRNYSSDEEPANYDEFIYGKNVTRFEFGTNDFTISELKAEAAMKLNYKGLVYEKNGTATRISPLIILALTEQAAIMGY